MSIVDGKPDAVSMKLPGSEHVQKTGKRQEWLSQWEKSAFQITHENMNFAQGRRTGFEAFIKTQGLQASDDKRISDTRTLTTGLNDPARNPVGADSFRSTANTQPGSGTSLDRASTAAVSQQYRSMSELTRGEYKGVSLNDLPGALKARLQPFAARLLPSEKGFTLLLRDYSRQYLQEIALIVDAVIDWLAQRGEKLHSVTFNGRAMKLADFRMEVERNNG